MSCSNLNELLRPAGRTDLPGLAALGAGTEAALVAELQRPFAHVWAMGPAGAAGGLLFWHLADEVEVHQLVVAAPLRRRGLGGQLVRALIGWAQSHNVAHIGLEVATRNTAARALYASMGFVAVGRRPGYYQAPADDALLLRLALR